jgi:hypothetical protein
MSLKTQAYNLLGAKGKPNRIVINKQRHLFVGCLEEQSKYIDKP